MSQPDATLNAIILVSSLLVAIPAVRAAVRILLARFKDWRAGRLENALEQLDGQARITARLSAEQLKTEANDLIEFNTLAPTWALLLALSGIGLNIGARAYPLVCGLLGQVH